MKRNSVIINSVIIKNMFIPAGLIFCFGFPDGKAFRDFRKMGPRPGLFRPGLFEIHRINRYPVDTVVCFVNTYPLDSDLSGG